MKVKVKARARVRVKVMVRVRCPRATHEAHPERAVLLIVRVCERLAQL